MIYRQRFTSLGWFGAALFVFGPVAFGWAAYEFFTASSYRRPDGTVVFLLSLSAPIGAMLALVGREYYDATEEVALQKAKEAEQISLRKAYEDEEKKTEEERRKRAGF